MNVLTVYRHSFTSGYMNMGNEVDKIIHHLTNMFGDLEESNLFEIKVILNELLINAIKHGNKEDSDKTVKVFSGIVRRHLAYFYIEDEGDGFNFKNMLDCTQDMDYMMDVENLKDNGRGIMIVKNLCDEIKFNKRGNKVLVVKTLCKCNQPLS